MRFTGLLLAICGGFGLCLCCCLVAEVFFVSMCDVCVCCWARTNFFFFFFFKGLACLFWVKLVDWDFYFFLFFFLVLLLVMFCCCANFLKLYIFFWNFKSINFLIVFKMRKTLKLQIFYKLLMWWVVIGKLVYFVLDFKSINFFIVVKMRKMLELQTFLQITNVVSGY